VCCGGEHRDHHSGGDNRGRVNQPGIAPGLPASHDDARQSHEGERHTDNWQKSQGRREEPPDRPGRYRRPAMRTTRVSPQALGRCLRSLVRPFQESQQPGGFFPVDHEAHLRVPNIKTKDDPAAGFVVGDL